MKGAHVVGLVLGGFYLFAMNALMTQIKAMENFYTHMDTYANAAVTNQTNTPINPQPLRTMRQPYNSASQSLPN